MPVLTEKKPSKTAQARRRNARERRTRVVKDGGRRLELLLESDAAASLEAIQRETGESATSVIARLLAEAGAKIAGGAAAG